MVGERVGSGLQAGLAEIEITPPIGTHKIGWLRDIISTEILSPLYARVAVLTAARTEVALVQLDTLFVGWHEVASIRAAVERSLGFPGRNVMVAATHNHAGPAVTHAGDVPKDETYAQFLVSQVVQIFGEALDSLVEAEVAFGRSFEWRVAHNRRVVMRDGTVRTHGTFDDPEALCLEGPIDPEVAIIAVRSRDHNPLGLIVNYACHPTHHGGDTSIDAGYPGALAEKLRDSGWPVTLFINGASGNVHTSDPVDGGKSLSAESVGRILAHDVGRALERSTYCDTADISSASATIELPYRRPTEAEIAGEIRGAQRFIDPAIYERGIPALLHKMASRGAHRAEVQALSIGDCVIVSVPGELFVEYGLRIKEAAHPTRALVATCANGRVGYIPTPAAFRRGGYETTFGPSSILAPEAGERLVETAVALVRRLR
jgi:neutral ceramidase